MSLDPQAAAKIQAELSEAVGNAMWNWIDNYCEATGANCQEVAAVIGRALISRGGSFITHAGGLPLQAGVAAANLSINEFNRLLDEQQREAAL